MSNVKEHWKILNGVMGKLNNKCDLPTAFKNGELWISGKKDNAESMNDFFSNVGPSTNRSVGAAVKSPLSYLKKFKKKNTNEMGSYHFTVNDIIDACQSLNKKKNL